MCVGCSLINQSFSYFLRFFVSGRHRERRRRHKGSVGFRSYLNSPPSVLRASRPVGWGRERGGGGVNPGIDFGLVNCSKKCKQQLPLLTVILLHIGLCTNRVE